MKDSRRDEERRQIDAMLDGGRRTLNFFQNLEEPFQTLIREIWTTPDENGIVPMELLTEAFSEGLSYNIDDDLDLGYFAETPSGHAIQEPFLDESGILHIFLLAELNDRSEKLLMESEVTITTYLNVNIPSENVWEVTLRSGRLIRPNITSEEDVSSSENLPQMILKRSGNSPLGEYMSVRKHRKLYEVGNVPQTRTITTEDRIRCKGMGI